MVKWLALTALLLATVSGCAQTAQYTPGPSNENYQLPGLNARSVEVQINDLRPVGASGDRLAEVLRAQIVSALSPKGAVHLGSPYKLKVDIIEHRSFFTLGNWNGTTRLRTRLTDSQGNQVCQFEAVGVAHLSNMFGYSTAAAVSQDAYEIAVADLISSLSSVSLP